MSKHHSALARKHLERRLAPLRQLALTPPSKGWAKAMREALGMTIRQLAARMRTAPSRITAIEQSEATGSPTLKTMRQIATAMECEFVYAFVPTRPLDDVIKERVTEKARKEMQRLHHTMRLENQAMSNSDVEAQLQDMIDRMISEFSPRLWDDEPSSHG